jgi:uncharacterized membrane protein
MLSCASAAGYHLIKRRGRATGTAQIMKRAILPHLQRNLIAGVLAIIPLWITWVVFNFIVNQFSKFGMPWVQALARAVQRDAPSLAHWLLEPWFQHTLAVILTLIALYLLGWTTTRVLGKRLLGWFDILIDRIPFVDHIYRATKKLVVALQQKPEGVRRVVLISFPSPEMKVVGFVTRVLKDEKTGRKLAAVYVPTTPNPTSGYLEIVPVEHLVETDWTMDEAMTFIISGGAVAPEKIRYERDEAGDPPG